MWSKTMAKSKPKPKSPFAGRWRIASMSDWDEDYINEEEEGFFEIDEKGGGEFHLATSTDRWTAG